MAKQITPVAAAAALVGAIDCMKEAKQSGRRLNREDIGKAMAGAVRSRVPNASPDYVNRTAKQWIDWLAGPVGQFAKGKEGKSIIPPAQLAKLQSLYSSVCYRGRSGGVKLGESELESVEFALEDALGSLGEIEMELDSEAESFDSPQPE